MMNYRAEIKSDMILKWNSMREAVKGRDYYHIFDLQMDHFTDGRWNFSGHYGITFDPFGHYFLKEVKGTWWLYLEKSNGEKERFNIDHDLAKAFFGITAFVQ